MVHIFSASVAAQNAQAVAVATQPAAPSGFWSTLGGVVKNSSGFALQSLQQVLQVKLEVERQKLLTGLGQNPAKDDTPRIMPGQVPSAAEAQQAVPMPTTFASLTEAAGGLPAGKIAMVVGGLAVVFFVARKL